MEKNYEFHRKISLEYRVPMYQFNFITNFSNGFILINYDKRNYYNNELYKNCRNYGRKMEIKRLLNPMTHTEIRNIEDGTLIKIANLGATRNCRARPFQKRIVGYQRKSRIPGGQILGKLYV